VDFCGITSGSRVDKIAACKFKVFYGKLGNAPLIEQCPVNLECIMVHVLDVGSHLLVVGKVEETHITENCFTDGKPDADKIKPIAFVNAPEKRYHALGEVVAKAYSVGKEIKAD
ncbi:flavin reductase family protein, partial [Chloroflexota bacterium]